MLNVNYNYISGPHLRGKHLSPQCRIKRNVTRQENRQTAAEKATAMYVPLWMERGIEVQTCVIDGNKNVRQLKSAAGTPSPWHFSSEYRDAETGLVYHNYRDYASTIEEKGGANLYMMNSNSPMNKIDYQGLADLPKPEGQYERDGSLIMLIFNRRTLSGSDGQFVSVAISGCPLDKKIISYEEVNHLSFITMITTYEKLFSYRTEASKKKGAGLVQLLR